MRPTKLFLVPLLLTVLAGCASIGGPKQVVYQTTAATRTVAGTAQATEAGLVCGRSTAPAPPLCITLEVHRRIEGYVLQVADYDKRIAEIMRDLPEGAPTPLEVVRLATEVVGLIQKIIADLPKDDRPAMQARAAATPEPPRAVSPAEWDALIADLERIMEIARREIAATS